MNLTDNYKKEVLQCRSCHNTFHQSDVKIEKTERLGLELNERICPYCGSNTYGLVEYPVDEIELLYNSKFYRNNGKLIRMYLEKVLEEV